MTPERHEQISQLYHEALELDPAARAAFLRELAASDEALGRDVAALLALDSRAERFLEDPALEVMADALARQTHSAVGRRIGPYQVLSWLGAGGMGEVYLAEDTRLRRKVALKLLPPSFTRDAQRVWRFEQEAIAASSLNHPNILTIYEVGQEDGLQYIATEFIEGQTLRGRLKSGPMPLRDVLGVACQIASALVAAHEAGIVHRDIKPENIMIRPDGLVKILDFGLAKLSELPAEGSAWSESPRAMSETDPALLLGTAHYVSPEQARRWKVDARSDVFSLGVVLYEMVAGRPPFSGEKTSEVLAAILQTSPSPLDRQAPDELQRIVSRALEKDRETRYQTAGELLLALTPLRQKLETGAGPPRRIAIGRRALLAWMVTLGVAGGGAVLYRARARKPLAPPSPEVIRLTTTGNGYGPAISPDGKYVAYYLSDADGTSLWIRRTDTASATQLIPPTRAASHGLTFASDGASMYFAQQEIGEQAWTLYRIPAPSGGQARKMLANVGAQFSLSPDEKYVAFVREDKEVVIASLDGDGERRIATRQKPDFFQSVWYSADGKKVAGVGMSQDAGWNLVDIDVQGGAQKILARNWSYIHHVAGAPDGGGWVLLGQDKPESSNQLWLLASRDGSLRRMTTDLNDYTSLSLSLRGDALVMSQASIVDNLWVMPAGEPDRAEQITSATVNVGSSGLAWTKDGSIVCSSLVSGQPEIWRMDADGGHPRQLTVDLGSNSLGLAVSPDNRYIAFISKRGGIWRIDLDGLDGGNPKQLAKDGRVPLFSPDSRWLYYRADETMWRVPVEGGQALQSTGPYPFVLDFSPDGTRIAYRDPATKKVGIAPATGGEPHRVFDRMPSTERRPMARWTPDGRALSYVETRAGVGNLWLQPIDGSSPKPLTHFKTDLIQSYAWSADGKFLAFVRSRKTSDVLMMRGVCLSCLQ